MIKKTIFTALLLLVAYSSLILFWPGRFFSSQHQWQQNLIKGQRYLFDSDSVSNVIVGSSLSEKIISDSLPSTFNLSFSGQSVFDGLQIVLMKDKLPEFVFIETNVFFRPANEVFAASFNNGILHYLRKNIPALRDYNQPIGAAGKFLSPYLRKVLTKTRSHAQPAAEVDADLFSKLMAVTKKQYNTYQELDASFIELKRLVDRLTTNGVNVVFFEMPVHCELDRAPRSLAVRDGFEKYFSRSLYTYLPKADCSDYKTTDGHHLQKTEARLYTKFFGTNMTSAVHFVRTK